MSRVSYICLESSSTPSMKNEAKKSERLTYATFSSETLAEGLKKSFFLLKGKKTFALLEWRKKFNLEHSFWCKKYFCKFWHHARFSKSIARACVSLLAYLTIRIFFAALYIHFWGLYYVSSSFLIHWSLLVKKL